jgi:hypothetical protein
MKKNFALLFMGIVAFGLATCGGGKDHEPILKELTEKYWEAVFNNRMQEAYAMLSGSSRTRVSLEQFSESMTFVSFEGEGALALRKAFAEHSKLTILGIEVKKKEATVTVILLVPALAAFKTNLEEQLASGEVEVDDTAEWMLQEMLTALAENRLPTQEFRVKMTWILEGEKWGFAFGQS